MLKVCEYDFAQNFYNEALSLSGIKLELSGELGKRTKFQQDNLSQLIVKSEAGTLPANFIPSSGFDISVLPRDVKLNDEILHDNIVYKEDDRENLNMEQQSLAVAFATQLRNLSPKHKLSDEEQKAYLEYVLDPRQKKSTFAARFVALISRSSMEKESWRTVERSLKQVEELINCPIYSAPEKLVHGKLPKISEEVLSVRQLSQRFVLFFSNIPPAVWKQKEALVELLLGMQCGSTALELLLQLNMIEESAKVYARRGQEENAINLLEKHLALSSTSDIDKIKYLCTLGDVKQTPEFYFKALDIVDKNPRLANSRIHRSLGLIFYQHPKFQDLEKAHFHISKAVKINPLQEQMWFILGCISLNVGKWDSAINGFRRSTNLNWDNFQAWGNLAAAHLQKGEKYKAFCVYKEAIKCEYDKPKLWENFLLVSVDCGKFIDAIQAYHRLIDLKKRWTDVPVLNVLVDNYEKFSIPKKKILELLGRVTSSDPKESGSWIAYGRAIGLDNEDQVRKDTAIDCYRM